MKLHGYEAMVMSECRWADEDEAELKRRVTAHLDAGADHVCIQVVPIEGSSECDALERLRSALR